MWLTPGGARVGLLSRHLAVAELTSADASLHDHTGVKLILLHEFKNDEGIRLFLQETWENYVKVRYALLSLRLPLELMSLTNEVLP